MMSELGRKPAPLLVQAMRLPFLTGSLLPVLVVAAWYWERAPMPWGLLLLTLAGVGCLQSGANLINDFYDAAGSDPLNHHATIFSGGSRAIQDGRMSRRTVRSLGLAFFMAAGICGGMVTASGWSWQRTILQGIASPLGFAPAGGRHILVIVDLTRTRHAVLISDLVCPWGPGRLARRGDNRHPVPLHAAGDVAGKAVEAPSLVNQPRCPARKGFKKKLL